MKKVKILNKDETDDLIKGIEDGDIIIGGSDIKMTSEEVVDFKKMLREHYDALSPKEKEEIRLFSEKLRKEDENTSN